MEKSTRGERFREFIGIYNNFLLDIDLGDPRLQGMRWLPVVNQHPQCISTIRRMFYKGRSEEDCLCHKLLYKFLCQLTIVKVIDGIASSLNGGNNVMDLQELRQRATAEQTRVDASNQDRQSQVNILLQQIQDNFARQQERTGHPQSGSSPVEKKPKGIIIVDEGIAHSPAKEVLVENGVITENVSPITYDILAPAPDVRTAAENDGYFEAVGKIASVVINCDTVIYAPPACGKSTFARANPEFFDSDFFPLWGGKPKHLVTNVSHWLRSGTCSISVLPDWSTFYRRCAQRGLNAPFSWYRDAIIGAMQGHIIMFSNQYLCRAIDTLVRIHRRGNFDAPPDRRTEP